MLYRICILRTIFRIKKTYSRFETANLSISKITSHLRLVLLQRMIFFFFGLEYFLILRIQYFLSYASFERRKIGFGDS